MEGRAVALIGALLLTVVLSTALGGMALIAAIERRTSGAHRTSVQLRMAAEGALAVAAGELAAGDWDAALSGAGSATWMRPAAAFDAGALTSAVRAETMMASGHGADTPVWQLFVQAPWTAVTGAAGQIHIAVWVADDWAETDGDPGHDTNGELLLRAVAAAGLPAAWREAVLRRELDGRVLIRHARSW